MVKLNSEKKKKLDQNGNIVLSVSVYIAVRYTLKVPLVWDGYSPFDRYAVKFVLFVCWREIIYEEQKHSINSRIRLTGLSVAQIILTGS